MTPVLQTAIDRLKVHLDEMRSDQEWMTRKAELSRHREQIVPEMLAFLNRFLDESVPLDEFRATFDHKTRNEWTGFGLKGLSGAMFLNMLVKYQPNQEEIAQRLRDALPVPADPEMARTSLGSVIVFLNQSIASGQVGRAQVQPARSPFFLSGWWHLQNVEEWPVFYPGIRTVLGQYDLYRQTGDLIEDYISFREVCLECSRGLEARSWEFEYLCDWLNRSHVEPPEDVEVVVQEDEHEGESPTQLEEVASVHTHAQWLLAKIGRRLGCEIWIAQNDRSKIWDGQRLGDLSLDRLPPLGMDSVSERIIPLIDVLWLVGNRLEAAFEIEHTTSVYSGLLRMSDLISLSPNLNFPLYIVAPQDRMRKVRNELSRPTFQSLDLHRRCRFFSTEDLFSEADNIMRWGDNPSAMERLATQVADARGDER